MSEPTPERVDVESAVKAIQSGWPDEIAKNIRALGRERDDARRACDAARAAVREARAEVAECRAAIAEARAELERVRAERDEFLCQAHGAWNPECLGCMEERAEAAEEELERVREARPVLAADLRRIADEIAPAAPPEPTPESCGIDPERAARGEGSDV